MGWMQLVLDPFSKLMNLRITFHTVPHDPQLLPARPLSRTGSSPARGLVRYRVWLVTRGSGLKGQSHSVASACRGPWRKHRRSRRPLPEARREPSGVKRRRPSDAQTPWPFRGRCVWFLPASKSSVTRRRDCGVEDRL